MPQTFRIVNAGDSVSWGQGLLESEKFDTLVKASLSTTLGKPVILERPAHSGAVIGFHTASGGPAPGEVPVALPTVDDQCSQVSSPETVDVLLVNGGINDVGVATILNPLALIPTLGARIESACHDRMLSLLKKISVRFTKPSCRILVLGYYPILSNLSDPLKIPDMLTMYGVAAPGNFAASPLRGPIVDRCQQFFKDSTKHLKKAVADAHDSRIQFLDSGFTDKNAMFVPGTTLLWGLDELSQPVDPLAAQRQTQCDATFTGVAEFLHREQCHRASAGHPNVQGSAAYAKQILAALGT
jgi:hypothetical protein